jgi:hypothetical protein
MFHSPRDLQREQLARKKLHNDMEDLKGKIRVYVRIRPMSQSERDRGSQEAVFKVLFFLTILNTINSLRQPK